MKPIEGVFSKITKKPFNVSTNFISLILAPKFNLSFLITLENFLSVSTIQIECALKDDANIKFELLEFIILISLIPIDGVK